MLRSAPQRSVLLLLRSARPGVARSAERLHDGRSRGCERVGRPRAGWGEEWPARHVSGGAHVSARRHPPSSCHPTQQLVTDQLQLG